MSRSFVCAECWDNAVVAGDGIPPGWSAIFSDRGVVYACGEACKRKILAPPADPREETQEPEPPVEAAPPPPAVCLFPACGKPVGADMGRLCLGHHLAVFGPYASAADIDAYNRLVREQPEKPEAPADV